MVFMRIISDAKPGVDLNRNLGRSAPCFTSELSSAINIKPVTHLSDYFKRKRRFRNVFMEDVINGGSLEWELDP
jgi:hypothetical protein